LERKLRQHEDAAKIIFERERQSMTVETPSFDNPREDYGNHVSEFVVETSIKEELNLEESKESKVEV
jgi:hypothetical protein